MGWDELGEAQDFYIVAFRFNDGGALCSIVRASNDDQALEVASQDLTVKQVHDLYDVRIVAMRDTEQFQLSVMPWDRRLGVNQ